MGGRKRMPHPPLPRKDVWVLSCRPQIGSSHQLWDTGQVGLCLSVILFQMEILMAAT